MTAGICDLCLTGIGLWSTITYAVESTAFDLRSSSAPRKQKTRLGGRAGCPGKPGKDQNLSNAIFPENLNFCKPIFGQCGRLPSFDSPS
jgi:hypothetical protein